MTVMVTRRPRRPSDSDVTQQGDGWLASAMTWPVTATARVAMVVARVVGKVGSSSNSGSIKVI